MAKKQSSSKLSTLAAKYLNNPTLSGEIYNAAFDREKREQMAREIKQLAASVLSQDETKGN